MSVSWHRVFRVAVLVLMLALSACKWTKDDVAETSDPALLERIYLESEDADVKAAALAKIDDPAFLFDLARGRILGVPVDDVMAALSRLSSQQAIEILIEDRFPALSRVQVLLTRMTESDLKRAIPLLNDVESVELALDHMTQPESLIWVFEETIDNRKRRRAFMRITDQKYLADHVINRVRDGLLPGTDRPVFSINSIRDGVMPETDAHVLATLTDQTQIGRVLLEAGDSKNRVDTNMDLMDALLAELTDQQALAEVAISGRRLGRKAAAKVADQKMLARIVREAKLRSTVTMVLPRVEDPEVLLEVMAKSLRNDILAEELFYALNHPDQEALLEKWGPWFHPHLVEQLTDVTLLTEITLQASRSEVRTKAVNNPNTPDDVVATAARTDEFLGVRQFAIYRADDQLVYEYAAINDNSEGMRLRAAEQLTDQASLVRVFQRIGFVTRENDSRAITSARRRNTKVRLFVLAKITDQSILKSVVEDRNLDAEFRLTAAPGVRDQAMMKELAAHSVTIERQIGVAGTTDEAFLLAMFDDEPSDVVRATIINRLETPASLRQIAFTAFDRKDRNFAARRLRDNPDNDTTDIDAAFKDLRSQAEALRQSSDTAKLVPLALAAPFDTIMESAAMGLSDPVALEAVAIQGTNREVLSVVLDRLSDTEILLRVSQSATDPAIRIAASQKSGAMTWDKIFTHASAQTATIAELGDALAAVTLFSEKQEDAIAGVQQAALNLIRNGDETRIPEMSDLLYSYGDKQLAEDYLNSGQPDLDNVAHIWASVRGYNVTTGSGSARARWGSRN